MRTSCHAALLKALHLPLRANNGHSGEGNPLNSIQITALSGHQKPHSNKKRVETPSGRGQLKG